MYFLYILRSHKDHKLYIGITDDLERRFKQHNNGYSKSTRFRRPLMLVYKETFASRSEAAKREWYFKNTAEGNKLMRQFVKEGERGGPEGPPSADKNRTSVGQGVLLIERVVPI